MFVIQNNFRVLFSCRLVSVATITSEINRLFVHFHFRPEISPKIKVEASIRAQPGIFIGNQADTLLPSDNSFLQICTDSRANRKQVRKSVRSIGSIKMPFVEKNSTTNSNAPLLQAVKSFIISKVTHTASSCMQ